MTTGIQSTIQGIECTREQLIYGSCSLNLYETVNIRQSNQSTDATPFLQDIILAGTSFVGTVVVVSLIVTALKLIRGGRNEKTSSNKRTANGFFYALIGLILVAISYTVIRLTQYLATG